MVAQDDLKATMAFEQPTFDFIRLPRELRDLVYEFYARDIPQRLAVREVTHDIPLPEEADLEWKLSPPYSVLPPPLALASKQTNRELVEQVRRCYERILIIVVRPDWPLHIVDWVKSLPKNVHRQPPITCAILDFEYNQDNDSDDDSDEEEEVDHTDALKALLQLIPHHTTCLETLILSSRLPPPGLTNATEHPRDEERDFAEHTCGLFWRSNLFPNLQTVQLSFPGLPTIYLSKCVVPELVHGVPLFRCEWNEPADAEHSGLIQGTFVVPKV